VRGERRPGRGTSSARVRSPASVELRYMGLDAVERITRVDFDPAPALLDAASAEFDVALAPRGEQRIFVRLGRTHAASPSAEWTGRTFFRNLRAARRALRSATGRAAAIDTSNAMFREVLRRSAADLYMLVTETDQGPYPYAGTPWFSAPFGRDGLLTALMTLWLDPAIAKGVLRFLAATQATALEPERDAQPGKILHELRQGEMARLREVPFGRYYGSVDATPLFVLLLGEYVRRTGDIALARELWPHAEAALAWIDTYGDPDGDGFVEYARASENGLVNQGWKDSHDAVFHADGSAAGAPIALCEVQAYVYGAKSSAAEVAAALGYTAASSRLGREAQALRARFDAAFWCEDLGAYALALDGEKRACRVVSSNAGHVLLTGLAGTERARRVAQTLLATDCFSGWGVRTLATSAHRYNPMSYHNGSVWPHDNALIALGFARYGLKSAVLKILEGLFDAAAHMPLMRLPELFCGFARRRRNPPTLYPVACAPQAWASTAMMALVRAALGLELAGATNEIAFHDPVLPRFLDELQLRRLRLAGGSADVVVHRDGKRAAAVRVSRCDEAVRVVVRR
jgi:glycogen debranching enzyme